MSSCQSGVSRAAESVAKACTRQGQRGHLGGAQAVAARPSGSSSAGAARNGIEGPRGPPRANFCGLSSGGVGARGRAWAVGGPPSRGPRPPPAAACAAQPRRVCAATQLACGPRPPECSRGPGRHRKSVLACRPAAASWEHHCFLLPLRPGETWCLQGLIGVTEPRPAACCGGLASCGNLAQETLFLPCLLRKVGRGTVRCDFGRPRFGGLGTEASAAKA